MSTAGADPSQPPHVPDATAPDPAWAPPRPGTAVPGPGQRATPPDAFRPPGPPAWTPPRVPPRPPALPVVPTPYHHFFRAPRYRWWRSLLALALGAVLFVAASFAGALPVIVYEVATGARTPDHLTDDLVVTPPLFAANNVSLGLVILAAMLTAWACFGQRPRWLSSVAGGIRWGWLLRCLGVCLLPYGILTAIEVSQGIGDMHWGPWSLFMIVTIVVTTPFQAAGEEYGLRGLYNRAVAAWVPNRTAGALLGGLVSSLVFMALHGAGDLWLNLFYFAFGAVACRLAYATGGLEAPIALHVVNNLGSEVSLPFVDISGMFDRQAGSASPVMILPQLVVVAIAWGLMELAARRSAVARESAPAAGPGPVWLRRPSGDSG